MIKVRYNSDTNQILGNYSSDINYFFLQIDKENKTITDDLGCFPYIEITEKQHQEGLGKNMIVVKGSYQEQNVKNNKEKFNQVKEAKILEAKAKREEKLSNFIVDEGIIKAKNRAETVLILEGYKKMLDQNITLAEYGLKDGKLIKLTKIIIDKWLLGINTQYNQAWLDYRAIEKKINNAKTISTLNKIVIK